MQYKFNRGFLRAVTKTIEWRLVPYVVEYIQTESEECFK